MNIYLEELCRCQKAMRVVFFPLGSEWLATINAARQSDSASLQLTSPGRQLRRAGGAMIRQETIVRIQPGACPVKLLPRAVRQYDDNLDHE